ncbi:UDP-3-0-acyl N-acetylglucosamine deacetylase [Halobacteroides halobius DSM 5150]|uniref:UDP-3-O-acyl-N-acetylglucosamine deacetylase n=1 Tax=Halobacteroides halobius (strain ATCC 35273 / DSM 5150 / MD-1) TaxID=748449 RepID=L0KBD4_HALHC|nr:UDP-3-O-acyl-N-acetylglucosamine deacetylase [Halobacteroides halobius]AGB42301.1 UDP-3-0-acyl N-acetylglucosamine deacetylase [Halobacteroides halobius DSM 5150]
MKNKQQTIQSQFSYTGIGLHTGENVTITCKPLPVNQGIKFKRIDLASQPEVTATVENVVSTQRCTTIGQGGWEINTIEHLMSAISALEIDNLLVEIDANEPPVTDGSAKVFYQLLEKAGVKEQKATKKTHQITEPIEVRDGDQYLVLLPADELKISYTFVGNHPGLTDQFAEFNLTTGNYQEEIAPARTFGFAEEIEKLKKAGLALGGSLENAILIEADGPVNELRFENEFVRHKILDIIGDLKLAPDFKGHIIAVRSGHRLNSILAKKIKDKVL